jgi:SEC-C motif-containing protein
VIAVTPAPLPVGDQRRILEITPSRPRIPRRGDRSETEAVSATAFALQPSQSLSHCACGNPRAYADCCGRFHAGFAADNAVKLMRSRYSAYVLRLEQYLLDTWHASTRPAALDLLETDVLQWLGLEIRAQQCGQERARIEFIARYRVGGPGWPIERQHETARFVKEEDGRWYYVDGESPTPPRAYTAGA